MIGTRAAFLPVVEPGARITETPRLYVRTVCVEDRDAYLEVFGDAALARYDDYGIVTDDEVDSILEAAVVASTTSDVEREFAVVDAHAARVLGFLTLRRAIEGIGIGYHFAPRAHGFGFATESVIAIVAWIRMVSTARIQAFCDPDNEASIRLLGRVGFVLEGERLQNGKRELVFVAPETAQDQPFDDRMRSTS